VLSILVLFELGLVVFMKVVILDDSFTMALKSFKTVYNSSYNYFSKKSSSCPFCRVCRAIFENDWIGETRYELFFEFCYNRIK